MHLYRERYRAFVLTTAESQPYTTCFGGSKTLQTGLFFSFSFRSADPTGDGEPRRKMQAKTMEAGYEAISGRTTLRNRGVLILHLRKI
ncbi:hypothetical protein Agabi119p4_1442 [Agaricus bisporus var. burnettii]|uniref:Uncharacterized protein n=1 Tax=Agaricus bisporus var. burnettii TaxID=192524 RepID=A0A8H7KKP4_AGABI|nr:hypothetical protein Agabi119p4_1442 [Agaricus bisporus var. burnettii]